MKPLRCFFPVSARCAILMLAIATGGNAGVTLTPVSSTMPFAPAQPQFSINASITPSTATDANNNSASDYIERLELSNPTHGAFSHITVSGESYTGNWADPRGALSASTQAYTVKAFGYHYEAYNYGWVEPGEGEEEGHWDTGINATWTLFAEATITFTIQAKLAQTIAFPSPGNPDMGDVVELAATASSGLPVSYSLISGPAVLAGSTLVISGSGTVAVRAMQAGDSVFLAATDVDRTFTTGSGGSAADTLLATASFSYIGPYGQQYVVPASTDYVVITASGGGGGATVYRGTQQNSSNGGRGGTISATYLAFPGETFAISVGGGGAAVNSDSTTLALGAFPAGVAGGWPNGGAGGAGGGGGGGGSLVVTPRGMVWAAGGGGGGWNLSGSLANHAGGDGGIPSGSDGASRAFDNWSAGGATVSAGGTGGVGWPTVTNYIRGFASSGGSYQTGAAGGGGGGGGWFGGGGGSVNQSWSYYYSTWMPEGSGGGGGGSSVASGAALKKTYQFANNGGVVSGAAIAQPGGSGSVTIAAYKHNNPAPPVITSVLLANATTQQPTEYWIGATRRPTSYGATGLPPGLSLDSVTGRISGTPTAVGSYSVTIAATNMTGAAQAVLVWRIDDTPPSTPVAAAIQATSIGLSSVVLSWTVSTDNLSGVTGYEVQRDGISLGVVAGAEYAAAGLTGGCTYQFKVRACDAAGNWSAWSDAKSVTTLADSSPPSEPTAVAVVSVTASSVSLTWAPSTDNVGVTSYEVVRDDTISAGITSTTALTVAGLAANTTYRFRVKARDAAGNGSTLSQEKSVKTAMAGADTLLATTVFSTSDRTTQTYTVPAEANYVVVKTWGAGGGGFKNPTATTAGGNADYASATYNVTPGEKLTVAVGTGGAGWTMAEGTAGATGSGLGGWPGGAFGGAYGGGGGYSKVALPAGTVWAKGGLGSNGATGGALGGANATGPAYNVVVKSGATAPAGVDDLHYANNRTGVGGFVLSNATERNGGSGEVAILAYKTPGPNLTMTFFPTGGPQSFTLPAGASSVQVKAWGGGQAGASSIAGQGGRYATASYTVSSGQTIVVAPGAGGANGAGGTASVVTLPGGASLSASGGSSPGDATPQSSTDVNYPGNNVAVGGTASGGPGADGAVVLIVQIAPPVITSPNSVAVLQNQLINYSITASNGPTSFNATNVPVGLEFNPATGNLSGRLANSGDHTILITATNRGGVSGEVSLRLEITADTAPPSWSGAVGLQATNQTHQSVTLSWNAATDNVGVSAYEVKRGEVSTGVLSTGATISGLLPSTSYAWSVRARDGAGNWSAWSAPVTIGTNPVPQIQPFSTVFLPGGATTYTVSNDTSYVVVKAWGAGGAGTSATGASGGAGAFASATYPVVPGQTITVAPGASSSKATIVTLPGGTVIYAGAGGGAGTSFSAIGGAGGAPNGSHGWGGYNNQNGGRGGVTNGNNTGTGGAGGLGSGSVWEPTGEYDEEDNPIYQEVNVGHGLAGGVNTVNGGAPGNPGDQTGSNVYGGAGGGGLGGGGGGGSGYENGGGGGGSSGIVVGSQAPSSTLFLAGSFYTPPNTTDPDYPGGGVAAGGSGGANPGGAGAVVIVAYPGTPAFTGSMALNVVAYQPINHTILTAPAATSYAVSGLPAGLSLNPGTGVISGQVSAAGNYVAYVSATNTMGTTQASFTVNVAADTVAPLAPSGLVASNLTINSFLLAWTAGTDNAGVKDHEVMLGNTSLGFVPGTSLTVNGVSTASHQVKIRGRDHSGNLSEWSSVLTVPLSAGGPTQATYVSYAERSSNAITLVWSPLPGATGGYMVFQDGVEKGTTTSLVFFARNLSPGQTYTYVVRALDASGGFAGASTSVTVTTEGVQADTNANTVPDATERRLLDIGTLETLGSAPFDSGNGLQQRIHRPSL